MAITKPPVLPSWAEAGDKVQPSNAEIQSGWPLSSIPPSRQRFNWLLNFLANGIRYFTRRGLPDYDAAETYMIGDRIIGDDGKTYKCLVDNTTGLAPSTNPAKWGRWGFTLAEIDAEGTTPAKFDNSVKRASTAFVKQAGVQFSASVTKTLPLTLVAADLGSSIYLSGSGAITLPSSASCPSGCVLSIFNTTLNAVTLNRSGADQIAVNGGAFVNSIVLQPGESLLIVSNSASPWFAIGGTACNQFAGSFGATPTSNNGYQKLPGGLIIQWGNFTPAAGGSTLTFPIAFPNACRSFVGTVSSSFGQNDTVVSQSLYGTTGIGVQALIGSTGAGISVPVCWIAIGN